tara:strand:- start:159 stop:389 length:231 start_codon:yes stop_codon:yes gene_type:complete
MAPSSLRLRAAPEGARGRHLGAAILGQPASWAALAGHIGAHVGVRVRARLRLRLRVRVRVRVRVGARVGVRATLGG